MTNDMLRNMYKGRPPPLPPRLDDDDDDLAETGDSFDSHSSSFLNPSPAVHPSKLRQGGASGGRGLPSASNRYAPLEWNAFFQEKRSVTVPAEAEDEADITFNVYETKGRPGAPVFVMHHGAGLAALSFALTARGIRKLVGDEVGLLSFDVRGHGETTSGDENNLSLDRLAKDLENVIHAVYGQHLPDIILVGHSMGGAVVSEAASRGVIPNLIGVAVLDIVEGVAIETLAYLHGWLERRPVNFRSLDKVAQWSVKSGTVRNIESARVSCPPLVKLINNSTLENPCYGWRTDLAASEQYWKGWFTGLTEKFLSCRAGKLLVLAGTDRLDKDMTIAQMQGKFQMLVFPNSGHCVQEDDPERMARELVAFWKRNERLPKKKKSAFAQMVAFTGVTDNMSTANNNNSAHHHPSQPSNGTGPGTDVTNTIPSTSSSSARKPSHLSIDSNGANSAFLHTLNSQLQMAAGSQPRHYQQHQDALASTVPAGESDFPLSTGIDRAALIAADFDTDEFLSARRHLPLEELKSQLNSHKKELKTELVELINSDYADFINLSTNLNGVDKMMEDLRKPLDKMKDDAVAVKSNLESVVRSLEQKLEHRAEIREKKASLQLLLNISESVAKVEGLLQISSGSETASGLRDGNESISVAKRLERVAIEYNQMQYLVTKGASLPFVTNIDWRLVRIKETMSENLSTVLRACIHPSQLTDADAVSNKESLTQCLRTYALIDQTAEAEKVISEELLAPFLNKTVTRAALSVQAQANRTTDGAITVRPLVAMFNKVLAFIDTHCSTLIDVTQRELKGTNFDIPVNCIWNLSAETILSNIPHILSPGIADDFHRNYTDTMDFVSKIEELCGSRRSLTRLRSQPSYQAIAKNKLPLYFQIRFKDISMSIEDALQANVETSPKFSNTTEVQLPASMAIIRAIERCWSSDVFLYGIAHSFWKFTLQLMARYSIWISTNLAKDLDPTKSRSIQSRSSSPAPDANPNTSRPQGRATPTPGSIRSATTGAGAGPVGKISVEETMLQQLSMVVSDVDSVTARIQDIFTHQIQPRLPPTMAEEPILLESFKLNLQAIRQDVPAVQERITALITKNCVDTLANVRALAVRYGDPPREPSQFVTLILGPLSKYMSGPGAVLSEEAKQAWTREVIVATTQRYSDILAEKLAESKSQEEHSNKLKAGAKPRAGVPRPKLPSAFSVGGGGSGTDSEGVNISTHDKLRLQCVLDVRCYKTELTKFKIEPDTFEPYLNLQSNTQPYENLLAATGQN
ncbi:Conserved oligomeric Golgi complex subunit 2 [Linnemannia schmuckeri]|uniref:Conserved oligomeric Golgi complex subunit 2 n=1 Tax=Linnemannia schmuckeri TaxID=64567 RepID=A0A9P5RS54_9FUNG|nr:Conserved oligomeric Golgi complex subunit 2 [Linnemannia schmuckeri]